MSEIRELLKAVPSTTGGMLELMLRMQFEAQMHLAPEKGGGNPAELRSPDYIRLHIDALKAELQELLDETGWKPWSKDGEFVNLAAARREWIDAWHFFMNLAIALEMTPDMILEFYVEKLARNVDRWDNDYDARLGKCLGCGRDLNDLVSINPDAASLFITGDNGKYHNLDCALENQDV